MVGGRRRLEEDGLAGREGEDARVATEKGGPDPPSLGQPLHRTAHRLTARSGAPVRVRAARRTEAFVCSTMTASSAACTSAASPSSSSGCACSNESRYTGSTRVPSSPSAPPRAEALARPSPPRPPRRADARERCSAAATSSRPAASQSMVWCI
eukprot:2939912-Prymnesium_polylepis.1